MKGDGSKDSGSAKAKTDKEMESGTNDLLELKPGAAEQVSTTELSGTQDSGSQAESKPTTKLESASEVVIVPIERGDSSKTVEKGAETPEESPSEDSSDEDSK